MQEAEEAEEAEEVEAERGEPVTSYTKGVLRMGMPFLFDITVLQAQGIPMDYTDIFCQLR